MVSHQVRNIQMLDTGLTAILGARKRRSGFAKVMLGGAPEKPRNRLYEGHITRPDFCL